MEMGIHIALAGWLATSIAACYIVTVHTVAAAVSVSALSVITPIPMSELSAAAHSKKCPYIHGYFMASFPNLTEPVPYTFASLN